MCVLLTPLPRVTSTVYTVFLTHLTYIPCFFEVNGTFSYPGTPDSNIKNTPVLRIMWFHFIKNYRDTFFFPSFVYVEVYLTLGLTISKGPPSLVTVYRILFP